MEPETLDPAPRSGHPRDQERYVSRPIRTLAAGLVLIAAVLAIGLTIPAGPRPIDRAWAELMADMRSDGLHALALPCNALGRGLGLLVLAAIGILLAAAKRWPALVAFALAEGLTTLTVHLVKDTVARPRPPAGLLHVASASFPSGTQLRPVRRR